jgi:membrane-bound serine protease (ClpP class)
LLAFFLFLVAAVLRVRRRRVVTGREGLLDAVGTVRRELEPGKTGIVLVQGELWQAVAPDGRLGVGEKVVVQALDGLLLTVRRATDVVPAPPRPASPAVAKSGTARA